MLTLAGCGHPTTAQPEHQVTTRLARVPADPDGFLKWITGLDVANAQPFARANEICDWLDQGYTVDQAIEAETAVIKRDWPNALDRYGRPAIDNYNVGFLVSGSAKFVCPEHVNKLPG